ncbi:MATE family efflux transporter [Segatella copri]|uniref:MATE efflux family protein n=1 Tax=Segatella copri TaxID=165179 RepID=A0AA90UVT4_9BACT|nr:hypothetical protein [Segatella copri]
MNWDSIKSILKLSIPLIISQLGLFFVQLSDTVMVGQIGSRDLAAISFGGNVYFFIYIFGIGIVSVGVIHDGLFFRSCKTIFSLLLFKFTFLRKYPYGHDKQEKHHNSPSHILYL